VAGFCVRVITISMNSTARIPRLFAVDIEHAAALLIEILVGNIVPANKNIVAKMNIGWRRQCRSDIKQESQYKVFDGQSFTQAQVSATHGLWVVVPFFLVGTHSRSV
jgi:hypothetical protein